MRIQSLQILWPRVRSDPVGLPLDEKSRVVRVVRMPVQVIKFGQATIVGETAVMKLVPRQPSRIG